ncbi:MAG: NosD domain-containing protein [Kiritimatiellia bacterium]
MVSKSLLYAWFLPLLMVVPTLLSAQTTLRSSFHKYRDSAHIFYRDIPCKPQTTRVGSAPLDSDCFETLAPLPALQEFSVAFEFLPIGPGSRKGNGGSTSGMLIANGSGYYDGWRVALFDWAPKHPIVEIGSPEGSWSLRSTLPISTGCWNRIEFTLNQGILSLKVNGVPAGSGRVPHKITPPCAPMKIGYAGFGVGSYRFSIATLEISTNAIPQPADSLAATTIARQRVTSGDFSTNAELDNLLRQCQSPEADRLLQNLPPEEYPDTHLPLLTYRPIPAPQKTIFLSPDGDDSNPGTRAAPIQSFDAAKRIIAALRKESRIPPKGLVVHLLPGVYRLTQPLTLGAEHSGLPDAPIVWHADETALLSGGVDLPLPNETNLIRELELPKPLPPQQAYGFGKSPTPILDLYCNSQPLSLASSPAQGWNLIHAISDRQAITLNAPLPPNLAHTAPLLEGYFHFRWAHHTIPIKSVDDGQIGLAEAPSFGPLTNMPVRLVNVWSAVDTNDTWAIDRTGKHLRIGHKQLPNSGHYTLPMLRGPLIQAKGLQHTIFDGINLSFGQSGGIQLDACDSIVLTRCTLSNFGDVAIRATNTRQLILLDNTLRHLARGAIHIRTGNTPNTPNPNTSILNNRVYDFGRREHTYTPAILLQADHAIIAHNHFSNAPSSAIRLEGSNNLIAANLIENVVLESDDQGALDMWNNLNHTNNLIYGNIWRNIGSGGVPCGQCAVRLDDAISQTAIIANRFENASVGNFGAIQIHGGTRNRILGNFISSCAKGISFSPWSKERWTQHLDTHPHPSNITVQDHNHNLLNRNVLISPGHAFFNLPSETESRFNLTFPAMPPDEILHRVSSLRPPADQIGPVAAPPFITRKQP